MKENAVNITLIFLLVFFCFFFSGCSFKGYAIKTSNYKKTTYYDIYIPNGDTTKTLIFLITPSGEPEEVEAYIGVWKEIAKKNNYIIASPLKWQRDKFAGLLLEIKENYSINKIIITGFSNGGYNSCDFGLDNPKLVDAIIPMGAYCSADTRSGGISAPPILTVVGEKDNWARGDDFTQIKVAEQALRAKGFKHETIIVPGLGHTYPAMALGQVVSWINNL